MLFGLTDIRPMTIPNPRMINAINAMNMYSVVSCSVAALSGWVFSGCFSVSGRVEAVGLMGADVAGVGATG